MVLTTRIKRDDSTVDKVITGTDNGGWSGVEEMQVALIERWSSFAPVVIPCGIRYYMPHYRRTHYVTLAEKSDATN